MTISMTGFAAARGQAQGYQWGWDIRSVNGKGLELRLRVPDWIDGLEALLRAELQKAIGRGNVSLSLRISREEGQASKIRINKDSLSAVLKALSEVEEAALASGVSLAQPKTTDVLALRGVMEASGHEEDTSSLRAAILADFPALLSDFIASRAQEGAALKAVICAQLDQIEDLTGQAAEAAQARRPQAALALSQALDRLGANTSGFDATRIAQELALLAVKQDVTEELDRLCAHIKAARGLLADHAPVGRKFDFLMQEFLREANTLLSKSQDILLSQIGLDLKTFIDQMREQVQNVE